MILDAKLHSNSVCAFTLRVLGEPPETVASPAFGRIGVGKVLVDERLPQLGWRHFATGSVGAALHDGRKLDLQAARKIESVLGAQEVRHATLAGLRIHPDNRLVAAADVLGINGQVRYAPRRLAHLDARALRIGVHALKALLDRVLVRARKCRKHKVAAVRVALMDPDLIAVFDRTANLRHIRQVELRINALRRKIEAERHEIDVASSLPIAKQTALDAVRTREVTELGRRYPRAAVIVGMKRKHDALACVQMAIHPFDGIRVHIWGRHLDRRREIDNDLLLGGRFDDVDDRVAHACRVLEFRAGE